MNNIIDNAIARLEDYTFTNSQFAVYLTNELEKFVDDAREYADTALDEDDEYTDVANDEINATYDSIADEITSFDENYDNDAAELLNAVKDILTKLKR